VNVDLIRNVPFFSDLTESERALIAETFRQENQVRGITIFKSQQTADKLYLVESGFVRLMGENGMALATLGTGSLLGEAEFLRGTEYTMSAVAAGDVTLSYLTDEALRQLIKQHPNIGVILSHTFGEQIVQMEDYLLERLEATELLGDLPRNLLRSMAASFYPQEVAASSIFYRAGEEARGLYLLETGALELHPEGDKGAPFQLSPGDIFGILPLLTNKPYTSSARSLQDGLVWVLPANDFYHLSSRFPVLRRTLGRKLRSTLSPADQTQAVIRLAQTPIFANMGAANLHAVAQRLVLQHVPAGELIYRAGDSGDALFLVDEGEVELTTETASGVIEELDRISTGYFFGEMSLLTGKNRTEDATTISDTNLWILYKADLDELVALHPTIGSALNQVVAARLAKDVESIDVERYRRFHLLANLSSRDLGEIVPYLHPTRYRSGEQIYRAGTPGETLYLIEEGYVRLQAETGNGGWSLGEGDIFGEHAVLTNQLHSQHAYAETDVDLLTVSQEELESLMMRLPGLAMSLSRLLSRRMSEVPATTPSAEPTRIRTVQDQSIGAATLSSPRRRSTGQNAPVSNERQGIGVWFSALSTGAKLRLALLVMILAYLFFVAAPAAVSRLLSGPTVASGNSTVLSASVIGAVDTGSVDLAMSSQSSDLQRVALAADDAEPTATYTPFPTSTAVPTNTPTATPVPTDTPIPPTPTFTPVPPTPVPQAVVQRVAVAETEPETEPEPEVRAAAVSSAAPRAWDGRLDALGVSVQGAGAGPGQPYWRLIEARWENEEEAGGRHHIYVEVLDEAGQRIVGQPVNIFWGGGGVNLTTENKPPPEFSLNYPMFKAGHSYNVKIDGLPSDAVMGVGLGTPDLPFHTIHTNFKLTFQKAIAP
jgi:CRP-like cAMP-binding protein